MRLGTGNWHLDPAGSTVTFHVKHFWGAITVNGRFETVDGEGTIEPDGTVSGQLTIDAKSLTTKNRKRDEHLRSADFFDVEHYPTVTITLQRLAPDGGHAFSAHIAVEAAGRQIDLGPTVEVVNATDDAVTLHASVALTGRPST